ncbi:IclR family transcriptional regulator [Nocardioides sp. GXZ039]|uniref:IclR family transcriptional regulator n=1 Tax=Nocardioides sp. GXZ039 TaxID=3136018 RepID=UPI0030F40FCB
MAEETSSGDIQAVARVAQILGLFTPQRPTVTAAQAAQLIGLNRSTASRYLASLESAGLLRRNAETSSAFEPSLGLVQLGAFALGRAPVTTAAPPAMRRLSLHTGHTVSLTVWGTSGPVVVHTENSAEWRASVSVRIGAQLPMNAAQTRVWLAFLDDPGLAEQFLDTLDDDAERERARADLDRIREGAMMHRVANNGVSVFAAPVFDSRGICACLGLLATTTEMPLEGSTAQAEALEATARGLTDQLGGRWAPGIVEA